MEVVIAWAIAVPPAEGVGLVALEPLVREDLAEAVRGPAVHEGHRVWEVRAAEARAEAGGEGDDLAQKRSNHEISTFWLRSVQGTLDGIGHIQFLAWLCWLFTHSRRIQDRPCQMLLCLTKLKTWKANRRPTKLHRRFYTRWTISLIHGIW